MNYSELPQDPLEKLNFWLTNVREARTFWETISPDDVAADLANWGGPSCGTKACFGGHLAKARKFEIFSSQWTYVPRLQVINHDAYAFGADFGGQHPSRTPTTLTDHNVSRHLFGANLFNIVPGNEAWDKSEHQIVLERLDTQEAILMKAIRGIQR